MAKYLLIINPKSSKGKGASFSCPFCGAIADKEYIHRIGHSVNELAQITPALTHPYPLPKWYPEIKSKGAVSILRASDGRNHWLLAGPSYPTSSGSISFDLPTGITLQRCFDSSITYKENQRYTFPIKPQRVLIFQLIEK